MKSAVVKRSVTVGGRKTSVSLEDDFWNGLRAIARLRDLSVAQLAERIDRDRINGNLSSAIRVFVFRHFQTPPASQALPNSRAPAPSQPDGIPA